MNKFNFKIGDLIVDDVTKQKAVVIGYSNRPEEDVLAVLTLTNLGNMPIVNTLESMASNWKQTGVHFDDVPKMLEMLTF